MSSNKIHWSQELRRKNLQQVKNMILNYGGYSVILNDMRDFQRFVAYELGCSLKTATEYIDTVRGATIFMSKRLKNE